MALTDRGWRYGEIDPDTACDEVVGNCIVDDHHGRTGTVVKAKCNVIAKVATRSPGKFLLDANNTNGRAVPLCRRGQIE
jgi:hypothetical protein